MTDEMRTRLEAAFTIHQEPSEAITHILTDGHLGVPPEVMAACPNLKLVSSYGVGYDAIDANAARARGVVVTHTPDVLNSEVATTAVMLMLACYREFLRDEAYVRSGTWATKGSAPLTRSPDNQVVGILGMGRIGRAIAEKLAPWTPTILYHSGSPKDVPYEYVADLIELGECRGDRRTWVKRDADKHIARVSCG